MMYEIIHEVKEGVREVWHFNQFDLKFVLVGYYKQEKPPRKRKWRTLEFWDKYNRRDSTTEEPAEIPVYIEVKLETQIVNAIRIIKWDEYKHVK